MRQEERTNVRTFVREFGHIFSRSTLLNGVLMNSSFYNREKLEAAILYFLSRDDILHLGKTKLMKLLYYSDFDHFEQFDASITGATYGRLPKGPVPLEAFDLIDEMVECGDLKWFPEDVGGFERDRFIPMIRPDLSLFNEIERVTLENVGNMWRKHSRNQIVAATHREPPWLSTSHMQVIPYEMAYYRNHFGAMNLESDEVAAMRQ